MLPVVRGRSQNSGQSLVRSGQDFDLLSPFGSANPWQMMRRMQEDMDRLFGQVLGQSGTLAPHNVGQATQAWAPHVDVSETEQEYRIEADLPGARQEDIDIQVQNGLLVLRAQMQQREQPSQETQEQTGQNNDGQSAAQQDGQSKDGQGQAYPQSGQADQTPRRYHQRERRFGYFERVMSLPENVDEEHIQAAFNNGVLTLRVPKQQPAAQQARRIPVTGTQAGTQPIETAAASGQTQVLAGSGSGEQATAGAGAGQQAAQTG